MTAGDVSVGKEVAINESETGDEQGDSTIFEELLLSNEGEQDRNVHSELDGISLDTLDELGSTEEEVEEDPTPWTADGVILYFAITSGLNR